MSPSKLSVLNLSILVAAVLFSLSTFADGLPAKRCNLIKLNESCENSVESCGQNAVCAAGKTCLCQVGFMQKNQYHCEQFKCETHSNCSSFSDTYCQCGLCKCLRQPLVEETQTCPPTRPFNNSTDIVSERLVQPDGIERECDNAELESETLIDSYDPCLEIMPTTELPPATTDMTTTEGPETGTIPVIADSILPNEIIRRPDSIPCCTIYVVIIGFFLIGSVIGFYYYWKNYRYRKLLC